MDENRFLYNKDPEQDALHILAFLDGLAESYGGQLVIDPSVISILARQIQNDFPHHKGLENASVFKKLANFVLWFQNATPISELPPNMVEQLPDDILKISNYQNTLVALLIALDALQGATIHRRDTTCVLEHRATLSSHSLCDIVDAVSSITPQTGFKMLTVLLEQIAYKNNPDCQYPTFEL